MKKYTAQQVVNRIILGLVVILILCMLGSALAGMVWFALKSTKFIIVFLLFVFVAYNIGDRL